MKYYEPKPILVSEPDNEEIKTFTSMKKCMTHYGIKYEQLKAWLDRGGPVQGGPRKGITFAYASKKDVKSAELAHLSYVYNMHKTM